MDKGIIYEDKAVKGLDIINPKTGKPQQTAEQWATKQIYKKTSDRIMNLNEAVGTKMPGDINLPSGVELPTLEEIQNCKKFIFRLEGNSPDLRNAMDGVLNKLSTEFPSYSFDVEYLN